MTEIKTAGIVLRATDVREADRILTVLTAGYGKISAYAGGVRRRGSRLAAGTQILTLSDFVIGGTHGRRSVREAEPVELFSALREDIRLLSLCSYFAELLEAISPEESGGEGFMRLLAGAMFALCSQGRSPFVVKPAFELRLMSEAGFSPELSGCHICGAEGPEDARINLVGGVIFCDSCRDDARSGDVTRISPGALDAMRHVLYGNPRRLFSFALGGGSGREFYDICERYTLCQIGRAFASLEFYNKMNPGI